MPSSPPAVADTWSDIVERSSEHLLAGACPSIRYRVNREVRGCSSSDPALRQLQQLVLEDRLVRQVTDWAQPDGWLAWDFHGQQSIEAGIRILCEKGVEPRQPVLARALAALQRHPDRLERGIGKVGALLDEAGFGGSRMIQAATLARASLEETQAVVEQVQVALDGWSRVCEIGSLSELAEPYKQHYVFKASVCWPGIYHLRLLAFTHGWRTPHNLALVASAVQRLVELSPLPDIHLCHRSQLVAPPSFAMHDFNPDLAQMNDAQWAMWFHRTECLARMGILLRVPRLQAQLQHLAALLEEGQDHFRKLLHHSYFTKWGAYTGLMLESDWRSAQRRINDLTFRSLLIMHFATATQREQHAC